jgi:hypothetical protein
MLRQVFESVRGVDGFGIVSMMIFIVFFTLVVIRAVRLDKSEVDEFRNIPFDESLTESEKNLKN